MSKRKKGIANPPTTPHPPRNSARNAIANASERAAESAAPPAYVPTKVFPVRVLAGATEAEQAQQVSSDLIAPEAAATRIIVTAEGKSVAGEWLDVPGTLAELRRVASNVNSGDLSHAEAMLMNQAQAMQMLATRLIERGFGQEMFCHFEGFLRLGLRAQAQSRQALETLAVLKQGPAVFARQANVAHGPQQVVNGEAALPPRAPAIENQPHQLSLLHEQRLDSGAPCGASESDQAMAPLGEKHRAENT